MEHTAEACDDSLSRRMNILSDSHNVLVDAGQGAWAKDGYAAKSCSVEGADVSMEGPSQGLVGPPHDDAAKALFEQYSLFGAAPGTWCKDSDCSTDCSSDSEAAEATEDLPLDVNFDTELDNDAEVPNDCVEDLCEQ